MAIQELNKVEIEAVSGGLLGLNLTNTLAGLPVAGSLLAGLLPTATGLLSKVSSTLSGLPVVGGLLGSVLALLN